MHTPRFKQRTFVVAFIAVLMMCSPILSAQEYIDKIVDQACNCVSQLEGDLSGEAYTMKAGLCMIQAAEPYSKKLKKDFDIDLSRADEEGEALGRLLGLKMITACPEVIMRLAELATDTDEELDEVEGYEFASSSGLVTEIVEEPFVVFTMKEESGKVVKMYWLTFVESDFAMMSQFSSLLGRKLTIEYSEVEIFDSRLKEYRNINIIETLSLD